MVVTAIFNGLIPAISKDRIAMGAFIIVCLVIGLIAKESLAHHNHHPRIAHLHEALKLIWAPLAIATIIVLGQQLFYAGVV